MTEHLSVKILRGLSMGCVVMLANCTAKASPPPAVADKDKRPKFIRIVPPNAPITGHSVYKGISLHTAIDNKDTLSMDGSLRSCVSIRNTNNIGAIVLYSSLTYGHADSFIIKVTDDAGRPVRPNFLASSFPRIQTLNDPLYSLVLEPQMAVTKCGVTYVKHYINKPGKYKISYSYVSPVNDLTDWSHYAPEFAQDLAQSQALRSHGAIQSNIVEITVTE